MKEKFSTIDLFSVLQDLQQRCVRNIVQCLNSSWTIRWKYKTRDPIVPGSTALTSGVVWQILYLAASGVGRTQYGYTTSTEATRGDVRGCFYAVLLSWIRLEHFWQCLSSALDVCVVHISHSTTYSKLAYSEVLVVQTAIVHHLISRPACIFSSQQWFHQLQWFTLAPALVGHNL